MPELVAAVNALGEPGMAFSREPERLYPQLTLAAHVLGYTDMDGHGVTGMERVLDKRLGDAARQTIISRYRFESSAEAYEELILSLKLSATKG
jgi:cell division protein FtsI/penicillin-binding protein 2